MLNMRNYIKMLILIAILLSLPSSSSAQDIFIPQTTQQIKQKIQEKSLLLDQKIQIKKEEITQSISTSTENISYYILTEEERTEQINHMFDGFEALLIRFDTIITRLELRISKLEEQQVDVSEEKQLLEQTKSLLEDSYILVLATRIYVEQNKPYSLTTDELIRYTNENKASLKKVQDSLLNIVLSLKNKGVEEDDSTF